MVPTYRKRERGNYWISWEKKKKLDKIQRGVPYFGNSDGKGTHGQVTVDGTTLIP